jgi:hypothetical protein
MTINYYGVPKRDTTIIKRMVEDTFIRRVVRLVVRILQVLPKWLRPENAATIEVAVLRSAIERCGIDGRWSEDGSWEGNDGSWVIVNVFSSHVEVSRGPLCSDNQVDCMVDIIDTLHTHGLHVWDSQKGSWFPGNVRGWSEAGEAHGT